MGYLIRGRIPDEKSNPLNRFLIAIYRPLLNAVLDWPKATLAVAALLLGLSLFKLHPFSSHLHTVQLLRLHNFLL